MKKQLEILVTNDDGYRAGGIQALVEILRPFGHITVAAPKYHQSGMSTAVTLGFKPIAVKKLSETPGERWYYVDGTPATSCKWGLDFLYPDGARPDVVVSGINHGSNAASASMYSGTLGACKEAALAGLKSIGVSLNNISPRADFTCVKELFPDLFMKIMDTPDPGFGTYWNVNFPDIPASEIKGTMMTHQGIVHWVEEFVPYDSNACEKYGIDPTHMGAYVEAAAEDGETLYMMAGSMADDPRNTAGSDHRANMDGYISVCLMNLDETDYESLGKIELD